MLPPPDPPSGSRYPSARSAGPQELDEEHQAGMRWGETSFGPPVTVESGIFAGARMRFSLEVAQQPIHGRRKTDKDRRPLAHPPILRFRALIIKSTRYGWEEEEINPSSFEPTLLVCAAELYDPASVPNFHPVVSAASIARTGDESSLSAGQHSDHARDMESDGVGLAGRQGIGSWQADSTTYYPRVIEERYGSAGPGPQTVLNRTMISENQEFAASGVSTPVGPRSEAENRRRARSSELRPEEEEIERTAKRSKAEGGRNLFGSLHVQGMRVPAPEGGAGLWFLFTDLTVRQEGTYCLHFRVYDILSVQSGSAKPAPVLCECFSQVFKVYSPRNFPGLPKPTELAKHFAQQGFKLNTRKNERTAASPDEGDVEVDGDRPGPQPIQSSEGSSAGTITTLASTGTSSLLGLGRRTSSDVRLSAGSVSSSSINALLSSQPGSSGHPGSSGASAEISRDRKSME